MGSRTRTGWSTGALLGFLFVVGTACARDDTSTVETPASSLRGSLRGRDVLLLVCDALHSAHLGCYGATRPTSPSIDELATQGVRFASAYSQTAWTLPSVASLFTSLEQERHGLLRHGESLADAPTTLAELFREAGYETRALYQNGVLTRRAGLARGFDDYVRISRGETGTREALAGCADLFATPSERPRFVYLHLFPPHAPYEPPRRYRRRYDPGYAGEADGSIVSNLAVSESSDGPDDPDLAHTRALYDELLTYVDEQVGHLLSRVRKAERDGELLVVFTSDHGEAFLQHGEMGHTRRVFDEMVRVPLVLSAPGAPWSDGRVIAESVSTLDVVPTLVELFDLPAPGNPISGRSLVPALAGGRLDADRPIFLTAGYRKGAPAPHHALRVGRWKWVLDVDSGHAQLFDLDADPGELRDLSREEPEIARRMEARFQEWFEAATRDAWTAGVAEPDADVDAEMEALGYFGYDE